MATGGSRSAAAFTRDGRSTGSYKEPDIAPDFGGEEPEHEKHKKHKKD